MIKDNLIKEINKLPKGYISKKTINGKVQYYLQWNENGKKKSKYISASLLDEIKKKLELRKKLQSQLDSLSFNNEMFINDDSFNYFNSHVFIKGDLKDFIDNVKNYKKRYLYDDIYKYLYSDSEKVLIMYGLRRTGKTTLIRQAILNMKNKEFDKTAFIQVTKNDSLKSLKEDLNELKKLGYKYIFIDEITMLEDFIDCAAIFSDIYSSSGMKIILSGTDSLGFMISSKEQLYDRCILLHTTYISFKEFKEVLGINDIDSYIEFAGTMSISGNIYNEYNVDEYVDSSIAKNIEHSLKYYDNENHFRSLLSLYENNELTSAVNRVIEDINHRFTIDVLTRNFKSNDLEISKKNLLKDRNNQNDDLYKIDLNNFTDRLKQYLSIKNKDEQLISIGDNHYKEIKEYLELLDIIYDIEIRNDNSISNVYSVFSQPGLRYNQAKSLVKSLLQDDYFKGINAKDKKYIIQRIDSEIKGRMLEDIILLQTKLSRKYCEVFKYQFAIGEYDMVVVDNDKCEVEIYEIKHSDKMVKDQYRFLIDDEKLKKIEHFYGDIIKKAVLYKGETAIFNDIEYINIEDYLVSIV